MYISQDEVKELDRLCEELGVTPYKLLRLGFQVLCREFERKQESKKSETKPLEPKKNADKSDKYQGLDPLDPLSWLFAEDKKTEAKTQNE